MSEPNNKRGFDPDFDEKLGQELILAVRKNRGCFMCFNQAASKTCSACKVAVYCNAQCQRGDWKDRHKHLCEVYRDNRKAEESIPVSLRSCHWITDDVFWEAMHKRRDLLLSTLKGLGNNTLSFSTAVVSILDRIYLVGAVSFFDRATEEIQQVNRVLFEPVDSGDKAKKQLYSAGSGSLSPATRAKVADKWIEFAKILKQAGIRVMGITFGRGMMDFVGDADFRGRMDETGHRDIMYIPSTDYAFASSFSNMFG